MYTPAANPDKACSPFSDEVRVLKDVSLRCVRHGMLQQNMEGVVPSENASLSESLVFLDLAARVPSDSAYGIQLYKVAYSIVDHVLKDVEDDCETRGQFTILPTGSYKVDTKVLESNEFDFMLIYHPVVDEPPRHEENLRKGFNDWISGICERKRVKMWEQSEKICVSIRKLRIGWCIEVEWNAEGQSNRFSVDITLGYQKSNQELLNSFKVLCEKSPFLTNMLESLTEKAISVSDRSVSHAPLVGKIFDYLKSLSTNIIVVYRLMKVIVSLLLPKRVKYCEQSVKGYICEAYINSHELKEMLLIYVNSHITRDQWTEDKLPFRLAELIAQMSVHNESTITSNTFEKDIYDSVQKYLKYSGNKTINSYDKITVEKNVIIKKGDFYTKLTTKEFMQLIHNDKQYLCYFPSNLLLSGDIPENYTRNSVFRWAQYRLHTYLSCDLNQKPRYDDEYGYKKAFMLITAGLLSLTVMSGSLYYVHRTGGFGVFFNRPSI